MDMVRGQRAWGDATGTEHKINKTGLKRGHLQHLCVSKETPTRHHAGEIPQSLSRAPACWGATSIKRRRTNACSMENTRSQSVRSGRTPILLG